MGKVKSHNVPMQPRGQGQGSTQGAPKTVRTSAPPSMKMVKKQQQKVIARIVEMGPPDTWTKENIDEMWDEVVLFGTKQERLPLQLQECKTPKERVYVIMMCPYVNEFLVQKKWDVKSRLYASLKESQGIDLPDEQLDQALGLQEEKLTENGENKAEEETSVGPVIEEIEENTENTA